MNSRFLQALNIQKGKIEPYNPLIAGTLGIIMGGQQLVEVPDRPSYVYVMVRSSTEEVIQAFNQQVAPVYGLPVFIQWQGNRYVVVERDTMRYSNWQDFSPYLPRHASTHEFRGSAGDVVFVDQQQFLPLMPMPSGAFGNKEIVINDYNLMTTTGTFQYSPIQITKDLTAWNPTSPTGAQMVLVSMDMTNGGLTYTVGSGSVFSNQLTGTADVLPNIPAVSDISRYLPIAAVRLVTGTSLLTWQNIYDVRPIFGATSVNQGGGGGGVSNSSGLAILNNGLLENYANQLNLLGSSFTLSHSGTEADLTILAGGGGASGSLLLDTSNGPLFGPLVVYQKNPNTINQYFDYSTVVAYLSGTSNLNFAAGVEIGGFSTGSRSYGLYVDDEGLGAGSIYVSHLGKMDTTTFEIYQDIETDAPGKPKYYDSPTFKITRDYGADSRSNYLSPVIQTNQRIQQDASPGLELDVAFFPYTLLFPTHTGTPFAPSYPFPNTAPYHFDTANFLPTGSAVFEVLHASNVVFWLGTSGEISSRGNINIPLGATYNVNGVPHTHTGIGGGAFTGPFPQPVFGVYGESAGVPLGSGTIFNVRGTNVTFTISGTTLDLFITGTSGAQGPSGSPGSQGPAGPAGTFGVMGQDEGIPIGTGTVLNFVGNGVTASLSGSIVNIQIPAATADIPSTIRGLYLWLRSDDITGVSNGSAITGTWADRSGWEHDAIPINGPLYKTSQINGQPSVTLNGSNQYFYIKTPLDYATFCSFVVFNMNSLSPAYSAVLGYNAFADNGGYFIKSNGRSAEYFSSNNYDGTGAASFATGTWNYITSNHKASLFDTRRNGIADKSSTTNAPVNMNSLLYLGNHPVAGRFVAGNIVEVIMYNRMLTTDEISTVESYIKSRYGL